MIECLFRFMSDYFELLSGTSGCIYLLQQLMEGQSSFANQNKRSEGYNESSTAFKNEESFEELFKDIFDTPQYGVSFQKIAAMYTTFQKELNKIDRFFQGLITEIATIRDNILNNSFDAFCGLVQQETNLSRTEIEEKVKEVVES